MDMTIRHGNMDHHWDSMMMKATLFSSSFIFCNKVCLAHHWDSMRIHELHVQIVGLLFLMFCVSQFKILEKANPWPYNSIDIITRALDDTNMLMVFEGEVG